MINLAASNVPLRELARPNQVTFTMARIAAEEVLYLAPIGTAGTREEIDVMGYTPRGDLRLTELRPPEWSTFLKLAQQVDDGEAATIAIANERNWPLATDDRKAQRLARANTPPLKFVTTTTLLRCWATENDEPAPRISAALRNIEARGAFAPRRNDPDRAWWNRARQ